MTSPATVARSRTSVLLTDLYELTMLQAYFAENMNGNAVFELFVRALPAQRHFLLAAGLQHVIDYLDELHFTDDELEWLAQSERFTPAFVESLRDLAFTGDLDALPEGTVAFPDEPLLRVRAPLREAQLVESRLMNLVHYATLAATKAARCVLAAPGRVLVDFGLRRAHAGEAGLLSARASYLAGFAGSATLEAGRQFGVPVFGTMAHSYVQAHASEAAAFEAFARAQPGNAVLLIDTYDTERATHAVVDLAGKLARDGIAVRGVRIDSGDLAAHARNVRAILDAAGLQAITIFASGNLDEHRLLDLMLSHAPIDGFGVGTRMNTSADAPFLDCAYKLQEYDGVARRKRSEGKATWPGRKQVYRRYDAAGTIASDVVTLEGERETGVPLLQPVLRGGRLVKVLPSLEDARAHAQRELATIPAALRALDGASASPVQIAACVRALAESVDAATEAAAIR